VPGKGVVFLPFHTKANREIGRPDHVFGTRQSTVFIGGDWAPAAF
jgi:hypothetical protein